MTPRQTEVVLEVAHASDADINARNTALQAVEANERMMNALILMMRLNNDELAVMAMDDVTELVAKVAISSYQKGLAAGEKTR